MAKRERNISDEQNTGAWMVTFSDLIMLLLTFFVLLLSMKSLDPNSLKERFSSQKESGVLEFSGYGEIQVLASFVDNYNKTDGKIVIDQTRISEMILPAIELAKKSQEEIKDLAKLIAIKDDERGLIISFQDYALFEPGRAELKKESQIFLDSIADAVASCPNKILIMGHTDDTPIKSEKYESNWELSIYRSLAVLAYFLDKKKLDPKRFFAGGYGLTRPLHSNEDPRERALNRRVEIIFQDFKEI